MVQKSALKVASLSIDPMSRFYVKFHTSQVRVHGGCQVTHLERSWMINPSWKWYHNHQNIYKYIQVEKWCYHEATFKTVLTESPRWNRITSTNFPVVISHPPKPLANAWHRPPARYPRECYQAGWHTSGCWRDETWIGCYSIKKTKPTYLYDFCHNQHSFHGKFQELFTWDIFHNTWIQLTSPLLENQHPSRKRESFL